MVSSELNKVLHVREGSKTRTQEGLKRLKKDSKKTQKRLNKDSKGLKETPKGLKKSAPFWGRKLHESSRESRPSLSIATQSRPRPPTPSPLSFPFPLENPEFPPPPFKETKKTERKYIHTKIRGSYLEVGTRSDCPLASSKQGDVSWVGRACVILGNALHDWSGWSEILLNIFISACNPQYSQFHCST